MIRVLLLLLLVHATLFSATVNVNVFGLKVGELTVTQTNNTDATNASANIVGNFAKANQDPGGEAALATVSPLGLTYMQTVWVNTNIQQTIFRPSDYTPANGFVLAGVHSDPPIDGYILYDGSVQLNPDPKPYYSTITPAGAPAALPPNSFGANQFSDTPAIPWANLNGTTYGMANLLNGINGSLQFESALVGVCQEPANPRTGTYSVCVLKSFTWGLDFTYNGPGGGRGAGNYTVADYTAALRPLAFGNDVSAAFRGAFDKAGNNAPVEWRVNLVQADNCPEPGTWATLVIGIGLLAWRRQSLKQAA